MKGNNVANSTVSDRKPPIYRVVESKENTSVDTNVDIRECTCGANEEYLCCPVQASICVVASEDARPTYLYAVSPKVLGTPPQAWLGAWMFICFSSLVYSGQGHILIDFLTRTM